MRQYKLEKYSRQNLLKIFNFSGQKKVFIFFLDLYECDFINVVNRIKLCFSIDFVKLLGVKENKNLLVFGQCFDKDIAKFFDILDKIDFGEVEFGLYNDQQDVISYLQQKQDRLSKNECEKYVYINKDEMMMMYF